MPLTPDVAAAYIAATKGNKPDTTELRGWLVDVTETLFSLGGQVDALQQVAQTPAKLGDVRRLAERWALYVLTESDRGTASFERIAAVKECALELLAVLDGQGPRESVEEDSGYICYGCKKPIRKGEKMLGSDVFSFYSRVACEEETKRKWSEDNPAPPAEDPLSPEERSRISRTLGRYASDPRFGAPLPLGAASSVAVEVVEDAPTPTPDVCGEAWGPHGQYFCRLPAHGSEGHVACPPSHTGDRRAICAACVAEARL